MTLKDEAKRLMNKGEYDPNRLFNILYPLHRVHYSRIREAIHAAKTE